MTALAHNLKEPQEAAEVMEPTQRIVKVRRDYNTWVVNETLEDYALRFTPRSFRKWSIFRVSNTAFGAISFLVLEAIGGTLAVNYGFTNALWAIMAIALVIFLTGLPISYYAAKFGLDMDLLTRGAGFGYIGSTISSFVYASFTFILFALEAAIMAYALELYFNLPLYAGYLVSALVIVPLVTHGVTLVSRIQMITQPIWLFLLALPYVFIIYKDPGVIDRLTAFAGKSGYDSEFNLLMFGTAMAVGMALIPQIGEQVDFLRFMPEKTRENRFRWHFGVIIAGPGWIFLGMLKMLGGALLAYLAFEGMKSLEQVVNPNQMYLVGFGQVFSNPQVVLAVTVLFVVISQMKVNMTNAYAGSLAWSNFFARLTHSHPGRVVWVVFNAMIAIILMEMDVFQALEQVLGLYSNIAISWITAVVADLVINKPLGLSPKGIEFRRAYLYDINPVGVGAMVIASILSVAAFFGLFGIEAEAFSAFIALGTALVVSPLIAWLTKGKYYIARKPVSYQPVSGVQRCSICERDYEVDDMAHCPAYQGAICSLCCSLDARCNDVCKPHGRIENQWQRVMRRVLPDAWTEVLQNGLGHYLLLMAVTLAFLSALFGLIYFHESLTMTGEKEALLPELRLGYLKVFAALAFASGIIAWWIVLTSESRRVAQEESNRQTNLLQREIVLHRQTDAELQRARQVAEQANQAKSRYITGISHELRTPLNSILGYAQLLDNDPTIPENRHQSIRVIRRSGEHLLSLIEGTLDIARIEGGKLTFDMRLIRFPEFIQQLVSMFELQARNKGIGFHYELRGELPKVVRIDQKRLSQILINILGNAVKFTRKGGVAFKVSYAREMLNISIEDTGPGIDPEEIENIFEPFARGSAAANSSIGGTGLGLTISKLLTELMGGQLTVESTPGHGSQFGIRLFLSQVRVAEDIQTASMPMPLAYHGPRRKVLVVDNEQVDRELLINILQPLGFEVAEAANGRECLQVYTEFRPDVILMDLAMPFMDGWEASYMIRKVHQSDVPIAIVSANAFDKGLENTAGIPASDFIVKPVNVMELLTWIGEQLKLDWVTEVIQPVLDLPFVEATEQIELVVPERSELDELKALVNVGYVRGISRKLDEIGQDQRYALFVAAMKKLSQQFELDAMKKMLEEVNDGA
ncbi:response regulator [Methylobacillus gramineus]|uniref:hybrid sensor histidine kinase/response regulator n=1 Tax=Methylobacillus gramineus TaxID=755169 RepID=UPI001CFFC638|nr:ATP-binding protein [Methylobacillus gramineus]MCB5184611.1 response regulator [Methylobacillus gramineus]